jgi:trypsin
MKVFAAVLVLCLVSVNAYLPVGPKVVDNVHARSAGTRVVGGTNAQITPWQISLVSSGWFGDSHICGGSLIGSKTVLTAAHCCDGSSASSLKVKYDGVDRTKLGTTNPVSKVTMHPQYSSSTIDNDYCVLTLTNTVSPSSTVALIEIADKSPASGEKAQLTGWGKTSGSTNTLPTQLQFVEMDILSADDCKPKWSDVNAITSNMICAQHKSASGCNGDSGGPLVSGGKLVGVVSWGANGCPPDTTVRPTVYADPASQKTWIQGLTN